MRQWAAAVFALAVLARPVAGIEPLDAAALHDLVAGRTITGGIPAAALVFAETLHADGTLGGTAGPAEEPDRWTWSGRWSIDHGRLCRDVPATNTTACLALARDGDRLVALRPRGKGSPPPIGTFARLLPDGPAIDAWSAPAAVVLALRARTP